VPGLAHLVVFGNAAHPANVSVRSNSPSALRWAPAADGGPHLPLTEAALVKASFTLVGNELDLVWETSP
jgi:hypothetical protein